MYKLFSEEHNDQFGTHNTVITDGTHYIGLEHWNGDQWTGYDSDKFGTAIEGRTYCVTPIVEGIDDEFETVGFEVD